MVDGEFSAPCCKCIVITSTEAEVNPDFCWISFLGSAQYMLFV